MRATSENYPMSYLMFVVYALVIIVLAAVFLLQFFLAHSLTRGRCSVKLSQRILGLVGVCVLRAIGSGSHYSETLSRPP